MSAITYRKPAGILELVIRTTDGILLRVPVDAGRHQRDRAADKGRKVRKLLRALVAYKEGKKK